MRERRRGDLDAPDPSFTMPNKQQPVSSDGAGLLRAIC